jgi:hypothetical protein
MVLDVAMNGRADWIVTHNLRDFTEAAGRFGLGIAGPGRLLHELESTQHE